MIEITHNFDPARFMWLWTKYVTGFNPKYHCTNAITGAYSKKLWKGNPNLDTQHTIVMDERPEGSYRAIYICGVAKAGYRKGLNYPHNVHVAILPEPRKNADWAFEGWSLRVDGGRFLSIPDTDSLPIHLRQLPPAFTTCRIFRWAAVHHCH